VHIETTASDGELRRDTAFDCEKLRLLLEQNGIPAKLSDNAGTSFCNCLYWGGLKFIEEKELDTKMVFVHVPFIKNIGDFELFQQRIYNTIKLLERGKS
jgi:pyrrolidone-carboxylate peptidase